MDGLGFMNRLAGYLGSAIPLIMLTGEGSVEIAVEVMKHGARLISQDTAGQYLKLFAGHSLPRNLVIQREREFTGRLRNETEIPVASQPGPDCWPLQMAFTSWIYTATFSRL